MDGYPDPVAKIAGDYLGRVKAQLRLVPAKEQEEFLREIQSHVYESYQQTAGEDDVTRILAVLRNLGEPADVVSERLPGAMVRSGAKRNVPLHIVAGILIALFGIPLGFGGVAVLAGVLVSLAAFVATYYLAAGVVFMTSALFLLLGFTRIYQPMLWDRLIALGVIRMDRDLADIVAQFDPGTHGFLLILIGSAFAATGLGMLWLGRYLVRGLRFLFSLASEWVRKFAQKMRRRQAQPAT